MTTYRARPREPMAARRSLPQSRNLSTLSGPESRAAGFRYRPDPAVQPRVSCRRRDSPDGRSLASYGRRLQRERIATEGVPLVATPDESRRRERDRRFVVVAGESSATTH